MMVGSGFFKRECLTFFPQRVGSALPGSPALHFRGLAKVRQYSSGGDVLGKSAKCCHPTYFPLHLHANLFLKFVDDVADLSCIYVREFGYALCLMTTSESSP